MIIWQNIKIWRGAGDRERWCGETLTSLNKLHPNKTKNTHLYSVHHDSNTGYYGYGNTGFYAFLPLQSSLWRPGPFLNFVRIFPNIQLLNE